jgi:hypothetical protein
LLLSVKEYKVIENQGLGEKVMSKDVINVGGEERVVREDTAKSYRGVIWFLGTLIMIIIIAAIIFFVFLGKSATDNKPLQAPGSSSNSAR